MLEPRRDNAGLDPLLLLIIEALGWAMAWEEATTESSSWVERYGLGRALPNMLEPRRDNAGLGPLLLLIIEALGWAMAWEEATTESSSWVEGYGLHCSGLE